MERRHFLKIGSSAGIGVMLPWGIIPKTYAVPQAPWLLDPATQPLFTNTLPNALDPGFVYQNMNKTLPKVVQKIMKFAKTELYGIGMYAIDADLGLVDGSGNALQTPMFGYGDDSSTASYPGRTIEVPHNHKTIVRWTNNLYNNNGLLPHLLPVDESMHWAYSLHGYTQYSIENDGVPVVPHLHGGHTETNSDGNPEYFFSPGWVVRGPRWVKKNYFYHNDQEAATLWYHDHALGITRLNVYAGLAGFYIIRDNKDNGKKNNPLKLPAHPYEVAMVIQDKMFKNNGELFWPAFQGDPFYDDFITGEGAMLPPDLFPGGGPTGLAEFFGDHILINGKAWPKMDVEPRNYRFRFLNGADSRFFVWRLRSVPAGATTISDSDPVVPFYQIGTDDGLLGQPVPFGVNDVVTQAPAERIDFVVDFSQVPAGSRIIMENLGPDGPFGGDFGTDLDPAEDLFAGRQTDRLMAFDVVLPKSSRPDNFNPNQNLRPGGQQFSIAAPAVTTRKVALFEGKDEFGRLQPLLGVIDPSLPSQDGTLPLHQATNGALGWFQDITENPDVGDTEIWEIYNMTGDAHPVHVHLVAFEVLNRQELGVEGVDWDISIRPQPQHNSVPGQVASGSGFPSGEGYYGIANEVTLLIGDGCAGNPIQAPAPNELGPKDTVVAYPGTVTRVKMTFDRAGRYVWHCHILSHEDHEMMRPMHVGPMPAPMPMARLEDEDAAVSLRNSPNPFSDSTIIRFNMPVEGTALLAVTDIQGRVVRNLVTDVLPAGDHQYKWSGRDERGASVAAGIYICRLIVDGQVVATEKMQKI